jgi:hypothetical protein
MVDKKNIRQYRDSSSINRFGNQTVFSTRSDYFDVRFQPEDSFLFRWPDVVEFINQFDFYVYAGHANTEKIYNSNSTDQRNCIGNLFNSANAQVLNGVSQYLNKIYVAKQIYYQNYDYTPVIAVYHHEHYYVTKGGNKHTVFNLRQDFNTCVIILSREIPPSDMTLTRIDNDQQLFDFMQGLNPSPLKNPSVEFTFLLCGNEMVPSLHFLEPTDCVQRGGDWGRWLEIDSRIWNSRGRQVLVQRCTDKFNSNFDVLTCVFDENTVKSMFVPDVCAAIICDQALVTAKLINALVWLSTDHEGNEVGQAISDDQTIQIIYNTASTRVVKIPPGLLI